MSPAELLARLPIDGGAIVSSAECCVLEIADARATNRFAVDENGFGYVRRSKDWLDLQKSREPSPSKT